MKLVEIGKAFKNGSLSKREYIDKMYENHSILFDYMGFIKHTDIKNIEINDREITMTTRRSSIKMVVVPLDKRIIPIEIINFGDYEIEILKMMRKLIKSNFTVLDIGGNAGWYAINLSKLIEKIRLHVFEPIPNTFEILKRNIILNQVRCAALHNYGLSNEDKDVDFYYYPEGSGNASMANLSNVKTATKIKCKVRTLDNVVMASKIRPDFMKVDVEGGELFVFQGGIETLKRCKPIVVTEMLRKWAAKFDYHPNQIINLFSNLGYNCYTVRNGRLKRFCLMDDKSADTNFFFLHGTTHFKEIKRLAA